VYNSVCGCMRTGSIDSSSAPPLPLWVCEEDMWERVQLRGGRRVLLSLSKRSHYCGVWWKFRCSDGQCFDCISRGWVLQASRDALHKLRPHHSDPCFCTSQTHHEQHINKLALSARASTPNSPVCPPSLSPTAEKSWIPQLTSQTRQKPSICPPSASN
jgi:hypothetical protein